MLPLQSNLVQSCGAALLSLLFLPLTTNHTLASTCNNSAPRPNIILILADDLGFRELGCFGQQKIQTPHLDRMAAEGMKFIQHYSGNAVCAPSRCVLMTGKDPGHAWIRDNREAKPEGQEPIPDTEITIAERLAEQGYATAAFGNWGLGGPNSEGDPMHQGFRRFFGYNCQRHAHSYYPDYLWDNQKRIALENSPPVPGHAKLPAGADPSDPHQYDVFKGQDYAPDRIHEQALLYIREHQNEPFFLYYPTTIPHVALHIPDPELKPYLDQNWTDPPFTASKGGYTPHFTPRAAYAAMVSRMDSEVGRILALLDELSLSENTLVVFSADNGTTHLKDEVDFTFFESVGELRGLKGSLYEGGVRVPTIARWPGIIAPGSTSDRLSGFEDWFPTFMEVASAQNKTPNDIDGISLLPTLKGDAQPDRPLLYREFPGYGGQQSIRVGNWKAIRQNMKKGNLNVELYDLSKDIGEQNDLAKVHPEIVADLTQKMESHRTPSTLFLLTP